MCGAHQLTSGAALATSGVHDESNVALLLRLRGGNNAKVVQLTVQPRVQKEKWSLYWKESMSTKTIALEPVQLQLSASTTIAEVSRFQGAQHLVRKLRVMAAADRTRQRARLGS